MTDQWKEDVNKYEKEEASSPLSKRLRTSRAEGGCVNYKKG